MRDRAGRYLSGFLPPRVRLPRDSPVKYRRGTLGLARDISGGASRWRVWQEGNRNDIPSWFPLLRFPLGHPSSCAFRLHAPSGTHLNARPRGVQRPPPSRPVLRYLKRARARDPVITYEVARLSWIAHFAGEPLVSSITLET